MYDLSDSLNRFPVHVVGQEYAQILARQMLQHAKGQDIVRFLAY